MTDRPAGQEQALEALRRLAGSAARTFLFAGPGGVGRRAAARWFAALLNCEGGLDEPCGRCPRCQSWRDADEGLVSIEDYRELAAPATTRDGKPTRRRVIGIDQLVPREGGDPDPLGPWLAAPPRARVRVGVIDGADELGEAAANAFLKTLEEPPAHARIVLIGSGPDALLPTVASRCTVVRFKPVAPDAATSRSVQAHATLRLGSVGRLLLQRPDDDAVCSAVDVLVASLGGSLGGTFAAVTHLQELWPPGDELVPALLRERARSHGYRGYLACDAALSQLEAASAAYAHRRLALKRFALALRRAWRQPPGEPLP